jgi:hypothetical protein
MDASVNLMLVSAFAGVYAIWSLVRARQESARLDAQQAARLDKQATDRSAKGA